ncbi:MAG TPA: hypothetical protein H9702_01550 [Candidatus Merdibacter merdavium]|uniref:Ig-like domain-containing protein n=1 Tax=Candidatus Merdibacter merdavium TaxID=2838692 RepID=A0A9D2NRR3_9FIRM|nr:hypothetical protein [Candidatus Merdibacter merdavium]
MKTIFRRLTAAVLAATMLFSNSIPTTVFAAEPIAEAASTDAQLQNGTAIIPSGSDAATVKQILFDALVVNKEGVDPQSLEWEYYCTGKNGLLTNDAWGSVNGFTSERKVIFTTKTYTHPALADNSDGSYQVRLAGSDTEVTLSKHAKGSSSIILNEEISPVNLIYNEDMSVDYDALREAIFQSMVKETSPQLSVSDVTIEYYASDSITGAKKAWMPLEGGSESILGVTVNYPAISAGTQQIKITYAGNDAYFETSVEATLTIKDRPQAEFVLNEAPYEARLIYNEDMSLDFEALEDAIYRAVIKSSTPQLSASDVTIEYYAEAETGSVGDIGKAWMPLEGGKNTLTYPAISAGTQQIRISFNGDREYSASQIEAEVVIQDRPQPEITLNEAPYTIGMVYADEKNIDYEATEQAIIDAVIASAQPDIRDELHVQYNTNFTGSDLLDNFKDLNNTDALTKRFGVGKQEIKLSWDGNREYSGWSTIIEAEMTDDRIASSIAVNEGASFTYNVDPAVMKQAILDNVIDWENSSLPAKESVSAEDFTLTYYATATSGSLGELGKNWAPIEGGTIALLSYPQMGAGEQQIRITFNGNNAYRPSEETETTVSVNKAKVKVSVHSTNIYADEALPADFITTDPQDKFDIYTVYAGITSNVTTSLYLDLPDKFTDNDLLKVIDPIVKAIVGQSFTELLNEGVTVGQLREIFSTQELLDLLDKLNIDTGSIGQILEIINKLPSIIDSVRISFGTPNHAGLYTVAAITDSPNYETGVGIGALLVKMRAEGVKLNWNQEIPNGKLSAEEAKSFDFGVTLTSNGNSDIDQSNVHYLYTGFTSKWKLYSSTTTAPTEPGRYVVTVVTLGGDYLAAPITRSFQITK